MTEQKAPPRPMIYTRIWCSECGDSLAHDGDCFYCETCKAYWHESAWDGDEAERYFDSDGNDHTWQRRKTND